MKEKELDAKAWGSIIEVANKIAGLPGNHTEKDPLHLANQLRCSAAVISLGLDIVKTDAGHQKQAFTRRIEMIETSLLEVINNLKIALIREYINRNDYDEACSLIEQVHCELITLKESLYEG